MKLASTNTYRCLLLLLTMVILVRRSNCKQAKKHEGPPVIKEHPKSILTRRNEPATLNCAASGATRIQWYRNGEPIPTRSDESRSQRVLVFEGSLYFMRVTANRRESDAGTYWCVASNERGAVRSLNATLTVAALGSQFEEHPSSSIKVHQGNPLRLTCRPPKGIPNPTVTWKRDGQTVANNSRVWTSPEGDLVFDDVIEGDAGTYTCVAQNLAGTRESIPSSVAVMSPPWFEERPKNLSAVASATIEFLCRARGSPAPSVTWRRLDGKMPLGRTQVRDKNNLRITDVSASDSGMYVCEAKNEAGSAMTLGSLKVIVAPEMKEKPNDALARVGRDLTLECKVEGDPEPLLVWKLPHQDQNVLLSGGQNNDHASVSQNGTFLKIIDLQREDSGAYYCWGISSGGGVSSRAEVVVVNALPPPLIGVRPLDQYVVPGSRVEFPCEVASEAAEATVTWWFQEAAHLPAEEILYKRPATQLPNGKLILKQVTERDAGIYTCRVSSEAGAVEAEAILKVEEVSSTYEGRLSSAQGLPAPPSKPRIMYYNSSAAHLTWLPNSRGTLEDADSYTIEYWRAPWQEWRVAKAEEKDTSAVLADLAPDTAYTFLVRAVNARGESFPSPWSDVIYTATFGSHGVSLEEDKQTRRKLNKPSVALLSATASSPSAVVLKWELLEGDEVEADGIIVYSIGEAAVETATIFGVASTSHIIRDLRPNTQYTFFLVPFWRTLEGVPSNSQTLLTPEEAPEVAPNGLTVEIFESGATLVKWEPLTKAEARGNVIGYRVSVTQNSTTTIEETQNTWLEVRGLEEGRLYTVKVACVSGGGVGPWSAPELIDASGVPPAGRQDTAGGDSEDVPSVFYAPPHPVWLLYLLVPIVIFLIIVTLLYLRKVRRKGAPSSLDAPMGPNLYSPAGVYGPTHGVNMYGEQKLWRPSDSDQDSSLSSARLLRPEHLANEYAEPRLRPPDTAEPYATTALLAPAASPRITRAPPGWSHGGRCTGDDIQVNWAALLPPPPSCPPPLALPSHSAEGETCSSAATSESGGERRGYHTGSSSQYENAGGSEQYERPCDLAAAPCDVASEHTYAVYTPGPPEGHGDAFQTFSTLQPHPVRRIRVDLHPARVEPPKSNTH